MTTTQAVILARGLGTRMRAETSSCAPLASSQIDAAAKGAKGMMPFGRPFLDFSLSILADAGIRTATLVVPPDHQEMRRYFDETSNDRRVALRYAVQETARGTADAVLSARGALEEAPFLVMNSDNLYPLNAVRGVASIGDDGLIAFDADALVADGAISPDRILKFALLDLDADDVLVDIREKPTPDDPLALRPQRWVSMNLWSFTPSIFSACEQVTPSPRGELEIQDAIRIAINDQSARFKAIRSTEGVLDLSSRSDIAIVEHRLRHMTARP
jgi:glucose-1-phosphate thymidylyltransferase